MSDIVELSDEDRDNLLFSYDFGDDGTFEILPQPDVESALVPDSFFGPSGLLTTRVIIADDEGQNEYLTSFNVNEVPPEIMLDGAATATEGETYQLSIDNFDPGLGDEIVAYYVDWDDGNDLEFFPSDFEILEHTFDDNAVGMTTIIVYGDANDGRRYDETFELMVDNVPADLQNVAVAETTGTGMLTPGTGSFVEGETATLTGEIVDPGKFDGFTLEIIWGDGEDDELDLPAGTVEFEVVHRYVNDGDYDIDLSLLDDDGEGDTDRVSISAENAAPELSIMLDELSIDEQGFVSLSGSVTDVGVMDSHSVMIEWENLVVEPATVSGNSFSATYQYTDDEPTDSLADLYTIRVTATDELDPTSSTFETVDLTVFNVEPILVAGSTNAPDADNAVPPGTEVTLDAIFQDIGLEDTFSVEIIWGDGNSSTDATVVYDETLGRGTIAASHVYLAAGEFDVEIRVEDDDTGLAVASVPAVVGNPGTRGDINGDGMVDDLDIDLLYALIGQAATPETDLSGDNVIDIDDVEVLVHDILNTEFGDANLDGRVDNSDFGIVLGKFGAAGVGWACGDINGDGDVGNSDFGAILGNFGFERTVVAPSRSAPTIGERRAALVDSALADTANREGKAKDFKSRKASVSLAGRSAPNDPRSVDAALAGL